MNKIYRFILSNENYNFAFHNVALGFCPPREAATMPEGASYGQEGEVASEARRRGLAQRLSLVQDPRRLDGDPYFAGQDFFGCTRISRLSWSVQLRLAQLANNLGVSAYV